MTDNKLKPCPFCGGEARIIVIEKGVHSIIECTTHCCGFMRHSFNNGDTDENAALRLTTAWNTRTPKECHCKSTNDEKNAELESAYDALADEIKTPSEIRAEAVKEFAEMVKETAVTNITLGGSTYYCVGLHHLDNLVKEFTEEKQK